MVVSGDVVGAEQAMEGGCLATTCWEGTARDGCRNGGVVRFTWIVVEGVRMSFFVPFPFLVVLGRCTRLPDERNMLLDAKKKFCLFHA